MKNYRVTALYERPEINRTAIVQADSAELAMVRALLEHKVPATFSKDEFGWLQPVFWEPALGGARRWPRIERRDRLVWGDEDRPQVLHFEIDTIEE